MRNNTKTWLCLHGSLPWRNPPFPKCTATYYVDTHFRVTWRSRRVKSSSTKVRRFPERSGLLKGQTIASREAQTKRR